MTFAPNKSRDVDLSRPVRTVLFWLLMMLLAVVLWRMASTGDNNGTTEQQLIYSEFMQQVDQKNVASAKFYTSKATSVIHGTLRQPPDRYRVTIANEQVRSVTDQLRSEGATIQVVAGSSWAQFVVNAMPFVLLLAFWIFALRRRQPKSPQAPISGEPQNRPIG